MKVLIFGLLTAIVSALSLSLLVNYVYGPEAAAYLSFPIGLVCGFISMQFWIGVYESGY